MTFSNFSSKFDQNPRVDLPAREVIRHGILVVRHVGNPIVGIDIVDAEEVQAIDAQPDARTRERRFSCLRTVEQVTHTDVSTLVGRCAE